MRRQLNALRIAVVGAGAIGCETVKNLVLLSAGRRGGVTLTDPDSIERTNLHRQLLYREQHLGRAKALVAAEVARSLDPGFQILGLEEKVESPSSSSPQQEQKKKLTASLWRSRDVILTALDNLEGRLAVDGLAVRYGKFLVDSGTQGTKANVQVSCSSFDPTSQESSNA